jgi:dTDP-4-dehydrorhamnose reductase
MTRVLLLGVTGMLGGMVGEVLADEPDVELVATARGDPRPAGPFPIHEFDARKDHPARLLDQLLPDWIVNAIGITQPHIDPASAPTVAAALDVNARFPYALAEAAHRHGSRVIQIATDGVFSGREGGYREDAPHDALDVYGKTKSLGEVPARNVTHLRCSIVGPGHNRGASLLAWLLGHARGARVPGYTDHRWNGITTWHFGRLCAGILREEVDLPSPLHVVPRDTVTKAQLLREIATAFGRPDLVVEPSPSRSPVDRSLATLHADANARLWRAAGYDTPPTVREMVRQLGRRAGG